MLKTIHPDQLRIKKEVLQSISPRPYSTIRDPEIFPGQTGRVFDPLAAVKVAANLTLNELFQHERLGRVARQAEAPDDLTPVRLIHLVVDETFATSKRKSDFKISRVVIEAVVDQLLALADNGSADVEVRLAAFSGLKHIFSCPGQLNS